MKKEISSELIFSLLENMPDCIYFKDVNSVFILANMPTAKIMGVNNPDELIGKTDFDFYPANIAQNFFEIEQEIIKTGKLMVDVEEMNLNNDNQKTSWTSGTKVPLRDSNNNIIGIVGISRDITERKNLQESLKSQELELAFQSGKAEIAADILHNIGNVLTSVYVSAVETIEILANSRIKGLIKANDMLKSNLDNMSQFVLTDPKAIPLMQYYIKVGEELFSEQKRIECEINQQLNKICIIKDILDIQIDNSKATFFLEKLPAIDLVNSALLILQRNISKNHIVIENNIPKNIILNTSKAKTIHIIVNLIKNAIEALEQCPIEERKITIVTQKETQYTSIIISDTGIGIDTKDMVNIFNHGFTTKKEGKGFGLHACANSMAEMKGRITVQSEGIGKGAQFTLSFPNSN